MPIVWRGTLALVEQPTSPEITLGRDGYTMICTYRGGPYNLCVSSAAYPGALGTGLASGYRVAETRIAREKGTIGMLSIRFEVNGPPPGATLPANDEGLSFQELDRGIHDHPQFNTISRAEHGYCRSVVETADTDPAHTDALFRIGALTGGKEQLCYRLIELIQKDITSFRAWFPKYSRTIFSWTPPSTTSAGGFVQTPPNPLVALPAGVTWLREGDSVTYDGTHYRHELRWFGATDLEPGIYS